MPIPIRGEHPLPDPLDWRDRANCRGMDTELFFPSRGEGLEIARATCAACDVRAICAEQHLGERVGFWGGMSERERRRERRRRGVIGKPPARCGTNSGFHRHRALGEQPCDECRAAHNQAQAEYRLARAGR